MAIVSGRLENHKGLHRCEGHKGLYENLTTSWHAQGINLAMLGSVTIVAHHMCAMPPYPYIGVDYATALSIFTHHMWLVPSASLVEQPRHHFYGAGRSTVNKTTC